MLNENIKAIRRSKGISQEELALELHVVRQTISKWERGLSVPDADGLIALSEALETPVSTLLGATVEKHPAEDLHDIAERLEAINLQLANARRRRRAFARWGCIALCALIAALFIFMLFAGSAYLEWDYSDPETAVVGVGLHSLEWVFARIAPFAFIGSLAGAILLRDTRR